MQSLLAVMAGGAIGAGLRFLVSTQVGRWMGAAFPWGTLTVNVVGSAAMGLLVGLFAHLWSLGDPWRAFLTVGLLGGFTTFSAFSLEVVLLIERGQPWTALLYALASVLLCALALFGALLLARALA